MNEVPKETAISDERLAEQARRESENAAFHKWWTESGHEASPDFNLTTENACHAAWQACAELQERRRNTLPSSVTDEQVEAENARLIAAAHELLANERELDRLSLVIESAVRRGDPVNYAAVAALLSANRVAISKAEETP